jgi:hypothetical protein
MNLYKYIKSLRKEVHNLSDHTYVRTKIFGSFITLLFIEVYMKDVILEYAKDTAWNWFTIIQYI